MINLDETAGEQPTEQVRALPVLLAEIRPYLDHREAARALCAGSTALTGRIGRWIIADGWKTGGKRLGSILLIIAGDAIAARQDPALVMPISTAAWVVAAWMHAPDAAPEPVLADEAPRAPAGPTPNPQEVMLAWIREVIGDRNGVHLSELLEEAHAHGLLTTLDTVAFRARLEQLGIPVRQQLKVAGRNRPGIHRDDLPQPPERHHSPEVDDDPATEAATAA